MLPLATLAAVLVAAPACSREMARSSSGPRTAQRAPQAEDPTAAPDAGVSDAPATAVWRIQEGRVGPVAYADLRLAPFPETLGGDTCTASTKSLPGVLFMFATCSEARDGAPVTRIDISNPAG
jgi:hypothetical protein